MRRSKSCGISAIRPNRMMIPAEMAAGTIVPASGARPGSTAVLSSTPKTTSAAAQHAGLAQGPVGEHDPAGAGRGEDARRGKAGHRDLVRGAQIEAAVDLVLAGAAENA